LTAANRSANLALTDAYRGSSATFVHFVVVRVVVVKLFAGVDVAEEDSN
jgi:hypothetical protein